MLQNPYVPPTAIVDIDFARTTNARPHLVWVASFLLSISLVIGLTKMALQWESMYASLLAKLPITYQIVIGTIIVTAALAFFWLTYKLWCGRNWARIAMLIWIALAILPSLPKLRSMLEHMTIHEYLDFAQAIAEVLGVYIVFATSARHWFASSRGATKQA